MESTFLYHAPCNICKSRNNLAVYSDHKYCFGCGYTSQQKSNMEKNTMQIETKFIKGDCTPLSKRQIDIDTVQKFNYETGFYTDGKPIHIANYFNKDNNLIAQKLRFPDKTFKWIGDARHAQLFGQNLWNKSKMLIICEGEIDALSISKINQNKFPVVSVKTGAAGAKKDIQNQLEWIEGFESVVFCFDNDEPGKKASIECAKLLSVNKGKIANLPLKDANEMLLNKKSKQLIDCIFSAKPYRPDGIIAGKDLWEEINKVDDSVSVPYPFECLNIKTHGLRKKELTTITAGSGVGKSSFCRHVCLHLIKNNFRVGYIALEESVKKTALSVMGIEMKKPLHLTKEGVSDELLFETFNTTIGSDLLYLYNHFGSTESDNLINKIRYLAKACNVDFVILDHLHMALSSIGDEKTNDERKLIDYTVSKLRTLVEETGIGLILVSHLKRPEGNKGYEDGVAVSMNSLRGSASIGQLSDLIISMSRDLQDEKNITQINILKNRFSGETGKACSLFYDNDTGCLQEVNNEECRDDF